MDNGFSFRFHTNCQTPCLTNSQVCVCNRAKRGPEVPVRAGATPRTFWAAESRKSGVAPAQFGDFFCVTFLFLVSLIPSFPRDLCASRGEEDGEDEAEVRNSYLLHFLRPNSHRAHRRTFLVGLERPGHHFGHRIVCKSGVAPAQHGVLPASKLIVAPGATSCSLGTCATAKVTARVTDMVICVFHAPITLPSRNGNRGSLKWSCPTSVRGLENEKAQ